MRLRIAAAAAFLAAIATIQPVSGAGRTWVIFRDRGYANPAQIHQALEHEKSLLLPATRQRLLKVRSEQDLLHEVDLPIFHGYLEEIERVTGLKPYDLCRAINGASYAFTPEQITQVRSLPCVKEVRPVRAYQGEHDPVVAPPVPIKQGYRAVQDSAAYGTSWLQNTIGNFIPAHEAGYTGAGVFVGQLDAGWNNLAHRCFDSLEIVATYDFVNHDSIVYPLPGDSGSFTHGTETLSCFAGYDPGHLIGTAHKVHVALARTEYDAGSDYMWEEDDWARGIEWLDSLGIMIATSSLSYGTLHTYPELNGDCTIVTKAADNAVARGIVVLNSVSNHGGDPYPFNKMSPPSDGDSVLGIGAVNFDSTRAAFSSMGPTYDGRIKPDLMALGVGVTVASPYDTTSYFGASGTSFSTPLTAGACALLLQAKPSLTPMQVQSLLKASATKANNPDTLMGWGIYNVWQTVEGVRPTKMKAPRYRLISVEPNPTPAFVHISLDLPVSGNITLAAFDVTGRRVATISRGFYPEGYHIATWNAVGLSSGVYLIRLESPWGLQVQKVVLVK